MDHVIRNRDQDQFANGQSNRDLRLNSDMTEPTNSSGLSRARPCLTLRGQLAEGRRPSAPIKSFLSGVREAENLKSAR